MKKYCTIIFTLFVGVALSACGGKTEGDTPYGTIIGTDSQQNSISTVQFPQVQEESDVSYRLRKTCEKPVFSNNLCRRGQAVDTS